MKNTINVILATEAHEIFLCCDADGMITAHKSDFSLFWGWGVSLVDNPSVTRSAEREVH